MHDIKNSSMFARGCAVVKRLHLAHPNEVTAMSPWQLDFRQIESGRMKTRVNIRPGSLVTLLEMRMSHGVHQVGAAPKGTISFGVPMSSAPYYWRGEEITGQSLNCFGNGHEFDANCSSAFYAVTLSISEPALEHLADQLGLPFEIVDRIRDPLTIVGVGKEPEFRRLELQVLELLRKSAPPFDLAVQEFLILDVLRTVASSGELRSRGTSKLRSKALDKALQIMSATAHENLRIGTLCERAGVSWPTLDRAFKERYGFGPKAYSLRLRLGRVREELCNSTREALIADIANAYGFWHMGQFAKDYRAMYGELPSDTLRP